MRKAGEKGSQTHFRLTYEHKEFKEPKTQDEPPRLICIPTENGILN